MSKEKDDKTDLSSMSKEELITYLLSLEGQLKQQKEEAQKKEQANAQSTSAIVSNLRAELSRKESSLQSALKEKQQLSANIKLLSDEKQELEATVVKLKKFRQSVRDLLSNLLDSITNYYFVFKDMRSKDEVPEYDENNLLELNMFMDQKLDFLLSTAQTFLEHQKVALNLSRTEQTGHSSHVSEPQNCSADITAAADGESEYRNAVTVETDDHDLKDFDEAASSVTISSNLNSEVKTDSSASNNSNSVGNELTDVEVKEIVIKGCSQEHKDSVAQSLSAGTKVLSEHIRNDITSVSDSKRKRKFERFTSINDCNEVDGTITNSIGAHFHMYSNECGGTREFILKNKSKRINSVLTPSGSLGNLRTILSKVQIAVCSECKTETEVNPATLSDFTFTKSGKDEHHTLDEQRKNAKEKVEKAFNSVLSDVGTEEINESKTDDKRTIYQKENRLRQNERKAVFNSIENSDTADRVSFSLTDDLIEAGDGLTHIINPLSFDAQTFGMMPLFLKSVMSGTLLGSCGTLFTQLGAPKNRISCFYEGNGLPLTREQLTGGINAFARAFLHNVATNIHNDILNHSKAVVCDESTLLCRELANKKKAKDGSRKSQIWVMTSSFTSPVRAAWYTVSQSRNAENVVDILKSGVRKDGLLTHVISDGYAGYDSGIKTLEELTGCRLKSARCWTHGRRGLFKLLQNTWLLRIYENELLPKGESFCNFEENLKKFRASKAGKKMTDSDASLLAIFYLINALFVIDSAVIKAHQFVCDTEEFKQDLLKARQNKSAKIVTLIFDSIRLYIADNPKVMTVKKTKNGEVKFLRNRKYPESGALIYLLKFEQALREFTLSPDVELSSSAAERALKLGICTRHACMFIQSEDGAHAFADYQTIVNTCNLNKVPVQPYLIWLCANIKLRLTERLNDGHSDPTYFTMPHKQAVKDKDGKVTGYIGMYDESNRLCYDKIDTRGLAPYDYRRYLQMQP